MYSISNETAAMLQGWVREQIPDADDLTCLELMRKHYAALNLAEHTMKASLFLFDTAMEHGNKIVVEVFIPLSMKHHWISLINERLKLTENRERLIKLLTTICEVKP